MIVDGESYKRVVDELGESGKHVRMLPSYIRFTQESCSGQVHTGGTGNMEPISVCIQNILHKKNSFEDLFPGSIQCFSLLRDVYSLENRRLFIARVLEHEGILETISVELLPFHDEKVQELRDAVPHWLREASTTDLGNSISVGYNCKFREPGCQDLGFTPPPCLGKKWWKSQSRTAQANLQTAEKDLARVQKEMRIVQLPKNVEKHRRRLAKFKFDSTSLELLKERILLHITMGVDDVEHHRYADFVEDMVEDFADSKPAYLAKKRLEDESAEAAKNASKVMQRVELLRHVVNSDTRVLMTLPTVRAPTQSHHRLRGLGHAAEYKIRLGFRRVDGKVEIFVWPTEECLSLAMFEGDCKQVLENLRSFCSV